MLIDDQLMVNDGSNFVIERSQLPEKVSFLAPFRRHGAGRHLEVASGHDIPFFDIP